MLGGKIDSRKSCWSGTEKTTDNFWIAPRHGLLQYVLEKIALLANILCVHKLYKVEWFKHNLSETGSSHFLLKCLYEDVEIF